MEEQQLVVGWVSEKMSHVFPCAFLFFPDTCVRIHVYSAEKYRYLFFVLK